MKLKGKKIALFVAEIYNDFEYWYPYYRMKEEGATVVSIGPRKGVFEGKYGIPAKTDEKIDDVNPDSFDAVIIPGGYAPDHMRRKQEMVDFVAKMNEQGKTIAAICHAGWMLASANVLKDKKVTSFYAIKDDVVNAGASWVDETVVQDGNLITSRNPDDLPAFCTTIINALS